MLKGWYSFGQLYIRPTPRGKLPYIAGCSILPVNVEIHPNPESAIILVD